MIKAPFRRAKKSDAPLLAELVNYAGEDLALYLWGNLAQPGETAWDVGVRRAARDDASFSYRNAIIIDHREQAAGCLIGYETPDTPDPVATDMPPVLVPFQELENLAPATWYVNFLSVLPQHRNQGLGAKLLSLADELGRSSGKLGMSVVVSDVNHGARRLYERCGYRATAARPMVKNGWVNDGENWLLLTKDL